MMVDKFKRTKFLLVVSAWLISTMILQEAHAGNRCSEYFMRRAIVDIQVSEHRGSVKVKVFKDDHWVGKLLNRVAGVFKKTLRLEDLGAGILQLKQTLDPEAPYFSQLIKSFEVSYQVHGSPLARASGSPVIFYANHPLSGMDAFAVAAELEKVNPEIKVLAASYLESLPGFKDRAFIVNLYRTEEAKAYNKRVMEQVNDHLKAGKSLLIFPSGSVSTWDGVQTTYATDTIWRSGILRFASAHPETRLQPLFVWGQPSFEYLDLRKKSVTLSNAYVFRELANQIGTEIHFTVGDPVDYSLLRNQPEEEQLAFLRGYLYQLGEEYYLKNLAPHEVYPGAFNKPALVTQAEFEVLQKFLKKP